MTTTWPSGRETKDPRQGFELAIKLSQVGVKYMQPSDESSRQVRPTYAKNASRLTAASHVIAINFATVAAASGYWIAGR